MQTSEVKRAAFKVAVEMYESARGSLRFKYFDVEKYAGKIGITDIEDIASIESYLCDVQLMQHAGMGPTPLQFTPHGISVVEASINQPGEGHGPFPPYNVVFGDVHAGAQIAIGNNSSFNQSQVFGTNKADLESLVAAVTAAVGEWDEASRLKAAGAQAAITAEASSPEPDIGLLQVAAKKLVSIAGGVAQGVATQALIGFLKMHGLI